MRTLLAAAAVAVAVFPSGPASADQLCYAASRTGGSLPPLSTPLICVPTSIYDGPAFCNTTTLGTSLGTIQVHYCVPR